MTITNIFPMLVVAEFIRSVRAWWYRQSSEFTIYGETVQVYGQGSVILGGDLHLRLGTGLRGCYKVFCENGSCSVVVSRQFYSLTKAQRGIAFAFFARVAHYAAVGEESLGGPINRMAVDDLLSGYLTKRDLIRTIEATKKILHPVYGQSCDNLVALVKSI